ncbi:peptidase [Mycobacterium sp. 21AC1]|uniref:peptidase n=1 Tax=[Mycobacterium] appelbergii TaxID=2939269 RepID=UPI00293947E2|nr:peptidase [Mycobacterium sp. 21AC1]MDV3128123.1 peptidase [Mycobacterium sp. 21AC1]
MRRSTTSAGTDRWVLALALLAELSLAVALLWPSAPPPAQVPTTATVSPSSKPAPVSGPRTSVLPDGRTAQFLALGGSSSAALLEQVVAELPGASAAVTQFWGPDWPRDIVIVAAGSDDQFRALTGGGGDIAATTTAQHIMFSPRAAQMSPATLRIVLRHELFHYAARARTAADAPRWLTEGVADYVGRPPAALPGPTQAAALARLPTDADLDTPGAVRSQAYDRAWWFARYVADRYGAQTLRELYLKACGFGHPDVPSAVRQTLGTDIDGVLTGWRHWLAG